MRPAVGAGTGFVGAADFGPAGTGGGATAACGFASVSDSQGIADSGSWLPACSDGAASRLSATGPASQTVPGFLLAAIHGDRDSHLGLLGCQIPEIGKAHEACAREQKEK